MLIVKNEFSQGKFPIEMCLHIILNAFLKTKRG